MKELHLNTYSKQIHTILNYKITKPMPPPNISIPSIIYNIHGVRLDGVDDIRKWEFISDTICVSNALCSRCLTLIIPVPIQEWIDTCKSASTELSLIDDRDSSWDS